MKKALFLVLIFILFYTRFVNSGWGLPYPMHPDERNMAVAVQNLNCNFKFQISNFKLSECLNPHFFAYGQFPLYIAYGGIQVYHFLFGLIGQPTYGEATIALRTISAISSIALVFILFRIIELIHPQKKPSAFGFKLMALSFLIFSPYAIQFAHFGTTESTLMLFYAVIIYFSLKLLATNDQRLTTKYLFFLALFSGLALGTKLSSLLFLGVPVLAILIKNIFIRTVVGGTIEGSPKSTHKVRPAGFAALDCFLGSINRDGIYRTIINLFFYLSITIFFFILSSPHNILNWNDFISSITYESRVGLGRFVAFYTRQFVDTTPILFQFQKILPFALGWPTLIGGILGFIFLPWLSKQQVAELKGPTMRGKSARQQAWQLLSTGGKHSILTESVVLNPYNILRFSLLLSLLPPSFFFSKWTRFISPSFPLFSLFAILFMIDLYLKWKKQILHRYIFFILCLLFIIPGIAQLSIYTTPDVRFIASEWMYNNIPEESKILTETANAIDIPVPTSHYFVNSFNFYDLDQSIELQNNLNKALAEADYIIIPSRRIFSNHTCLSPNTPQIIQNELARCKELEKTYPLLNAYYRDLFSGKRGFQKVAEFNSFPKISFIGKTLLEFPDEDAEETWTVFDHPVIRIYKKITNHKLQISNQLQITNPPTDFSKYNVTSYMLHAANYKLLIADTSEKWERGLMYVKSKEDIGGLDGMIFTFTDSQLRTFWNKNTLSHLTLYWIQNKEVVGISDLPSITETGTITTVSSPSPANAVIELIK